MIDSHCHLADETFAQDLQDVVARARAAGLERVLVVILEAGNEQEEKQAGAPAVAVGGHSAWPSVSIPTMRRRSNTNAGKVAEVVRAQVGRLSYARAIGEIGLDYHYDFSPRDTQQAVFRAQVNLACELQLPVVIHTREAEARTQLKC